MGDDAVALVIAEKLRQSLEAKGTKVIIGETDFQYCLNNIDESDYIIILDATCFGIEPGFITIKAIQDIYMINPKQSLFSQHGYSLITALKDYYSSFDGFVIGIEGSQFDYTLSLSNELEEQLENICRQVEEILKKVTSSEMQDIY